METELVKMSSKGQLVVPQDIREKENFIEGDRFIAFEVKGGILFKKLKMPDPKKEFESLSKDIQKKFVKGNITESDVDEAVKWSRKR
jgi:AbrB family looped-hinge helix DNA binding protein